MKGCMSVVCCTLSGLKKFMLVPGVCVWSLGGRICCVQIAEMLRATRGVRGCVHYVCVVHKISVLRHRGQL